MKKGYKNNKFKKAFTLVETLVALTIFVIGMQSIVMVMSGTLKNKAYAVEMGKSSFVVSRSTSDIIGYLRRVRQSDGGAYPIVSALDNDLVVFSDYDKDGKTERLHIYLTNGRIYLAIRRPSNTFPKTYAAGYEEPIEMAKQIVNLGTDPMFSYYNANYPADTTNNPAATPANVRNIRLIKVFLKINIDPNRAPDNIQQQSFVELRNLNDYDRIY
jgi:prepilin-type N-terminal cleavage/methylation domain-containing protein